VCSRVCAFIASAAGKAAAFYNRLEADEVGAAEKTMAAEAEAARALSDAAYEEELEALRKISAAATREVALRQAQRAAAASSSTATAAAGGVGGGGGRVKNPMHASPYSIARLEASLAQQQQQQQQQADEDYSRLAYSSGGGGGGVGVGDGSGGEVLLMPRRVGSVGVTTPMRHDAADE
jgi:hypothetical protein